MAVGSKKQTEIANRRKLVAIYTLKRMSQEDIADKLGVNQSTISRDLDFLQKQWLAAAQSDISKIKARELAALDLMEFEAAAMINTLLSDKKNKNGESEGKKDVGMALKYSEHRLKIMGRRAEMLGLYEPTKLDVNEGKKEEIPLTPQVVQARHALLKAVANARRNPAGN